MKKLLSVMFILVILSFFISCTTSTTYKIEPVDTGSTLVIGQINLDFIGFPSEFQINGPHGKGLVLTFEDENSKITTVTASGLNAFFGFEALGKSYDLKSIKFSNDRVRATISLNWACDVVPGQVNNLGKVEGEWQYLGPSNNDVKLLPPGGYTELLQYYKERYPESAWNSRDWTEISFRASTR